jgi:hypothetical protein
MKAADQSALPTSGARMKVGQKTIVRWISKRAAKRSESAPGKTPIAELRELSPEMLRHVGGGNGSPYKGW